jgi:two-component system OmpR family sensor kinase
MKVNIKRLCLETIAFILAVGLLIYMINNHNTDVDTDHLTARSYEIQKILKESPDTKFVTLVKQYGLDDDNSEIQKIKDGAAVARKMTHNTMTITTPIYEDTHVTGYLSVTDRRTSNAFTDILVISFAALAYGIFFLWRYRTFKRQKAYTTEITAKVKAIQRSPLTQSYVITDDDDAVTTALNHLGENIQQKELSEQAKRQNLYEFINLFEFAIFVYDGNGMIHRVNAAFANEFADTKNLDVFSPYPEVLQFLVEKMLHPTRQIKTFYLDRIAAYYEITVEPLKNIQNRFMVIMRDVTQYHRTIQAHDDFIANVSHELKTPLAAITGFADILQDEATTPDQLSHAQTIAKESKQLTNLVADIMTLTKQPTKIVKTKVDLCDLIQHVSARYHGLAGQKNIDVLLDLEPIVLHTNENLLQQIVKNLLENALYYTPVGGKVLVSLVHSDNKTLLSVTDNGPGMTPVEQGRIFQRFYRSDSERDNPNGTGLGLAIVKKNVEDLKGRIDVVSIPGKGTTFTVTL